MFNKHGIYFISFFCRNSLCNDRHELAHSPPSDLINFQIVRILNTKVPIQHSRVRLFKTVFVVFVGKKSSMYSVIK